MIPPALQTKLNILITDLADPMPVIQEAFYAVYGRYWQGLSTHAVIPQSGATAAPSLDRKPSDQEESWATFGLALPAQMEGALSVDVYETKAGHGYIINAEVMVDGIHYRRAVNYGPEPARQHDWKPFKRITL